MLHGKVLSITNFLQALIFVATILIFSLPVNSAEIIIHDAGIYNDFYGVNRFFANGGNREIVAVSGVVTPSPDTGLTPGVSTSVSTTHPSLNPEVSPIGLFYNGPTHDPVSGVIGGAGLANTYYGVLLRQAFIDAPQFQTGWSINASNPEVDGGTAVSRLLPTLDLELSPEIVTNVAISGEQETPTFSWQSAVDSVHNKTSIAIWRTDVPAVEEGGFPTLVHVDFVDPTASSFTIPEALNRGVDGNTALDPDGHYMIGIQLDVFEEDVEGNLIFSYEGLRGRARSFHEFSPSVAQPDGEVFLPEVDPGGGFNFNVDVTEGEAIFIDPFVAIGYDYEVGLNDPLFASVILPEIGDDIFELYLFDDILNDFVFEDTLQAGIEFLFDTPVSIFRILGIEIGAGLDPSDPTAFVTGLKFNGTGTFTGSMTPISVSVPEPGILGLFALGFASMLVRRRKLILV